MENKKWFIFSSLAVLGSLGIYAVLRRKGNPGLISNLQTQDQDGVSKKEIDKADILKILRSIRKDIHLHLREISKVYQMIQNTGNMSNGEQITQALRSSHIWIEFEKFMTEREGVYLARLGFTSDEYQETLNRLMNVQKDQDVLKEMNEIKYGSEEAINGISPSRMKIEGVKLIEMKQFKQITEQLGKITLIKLWELSKFKVKGDKSIQLGYKDKEFLLDYNQILESNGM